MRRRFYILALALMGILAMSCSPISAQPHSQDQPGAQVDVGIFYDSLAPYGDWVEMRDYGWSWAPHVERGWRPYTRGQWIMTDDGWFWDSDERFGWAVFHYGRWFNDRYYGWVWIPGTEWAPAWVSWRHGRGYTGWAPLPPRAAWRARFGLSIGGLDIDAFIGVGDYAFVRDRDFVDRGVHQHFLPPTQNATLINVTNNVTSYTVANQRVVNSGIAVAEVERAVGRRVPRARPVDVARADAPRSTRADEVAVFRPQVRAAPERRPAQGRSLVRGEAPPPLLVERRRERQQNGHQPEVTAKAAQNQRPAGQPADKEQGAVGQPQTPRADAETLRQEAQRQREQSQRDAFRQHARDQDQQRARQANEAQAQEAKRSQDAQQAQQQRDQAQRNQRQLDQRRARQASEAQAQEAKRSQDAQQAQQQRDQAQRSQQQLDQQRARQASEAQAQEAERAQHAQQERGQAQGDRQQSNQRRSDQQRAKDAPQQEHAEATPRPQPEGHQR